MGWVWQSCEEAMRTDIPLKRLTRLRPADIVALIGDPLAQVLGVEALELPAS